MFSKLVFQIVRSCRKNLSFKSGKVSEVLRKPGAGNSGDGSLRIRPLLGSADTGAGHTVVLISPQYVTPYVRRNKTDRTDVKGLLEAYRDSDIHPVPIKTLANSN